MTEMPSSPHTGPESEASPVTREPGPLSWFIFHTKNGCARWIAAHKVSFYLIGFSLVLGCFLCRAWLSPLVLGMRRSLSEVAIVCVVFMIARFLLPRLRLFGRILTLGCVCAVVWGILLFGSAIHRYFLLYLRYTSLPAVELSELPRSNHERIQPLSSVATLAHEAMTENEDPTRPDFVREGDNFRWTIAIEPAYTTRRLLQGIKEVLVVEGTTAAPRFGNAERRRVSFDVGENLLLSRNVRSAVVRTFGAWRYLNYEPADVTFIPDDKGDLVQVVSLIRWRGVFFPVPEFGGVVVIRQEESSLLATVRRILLGRGTWIAPEEVAQYPYLKGQNLVPEVVSRTIAESFRFQNGFLAPLPWNHDGDVRIPDLPDDLNEQPFSVFFEGAPGLDSKLYHYLALEPFDTRKQGLNTSVFVPADGIGKVAVYRHDKRGGTITGVSAVAPKVMESRKFYDWRQNRAVEHRPFIRDILGDRRFLWLTTVVTMKNVEAGDSYIAGSTPEVVLTDAANNITVWVDPHAPGTWEGQAEDALRKAGVGSEVKHSVETD